MSRLRHVGIWLIALSAACSHTAVIFESKEDGSDMDGGAERDAANERDADEHDAWDPEDIDAASAVGEAGALAAYEHTCVLRKDDTFCWGRNGDGQLGIGANRAPEFSPRQLAGSFQQLCAGETHSCGLRADGVLACWGGNDNGQLGLNDRVARDAPTPVPFEVPFKFVACGGEQTCAVGRDERLYCWGNNFEGQCGQDDAANSPDLLVPAPVALERDIAQVSVGQGHVCAISEAGALYCWGRNSQGQLGLGNVPEQIRKPTQLTVGALYLAVAAGQTHSCAVRDDRRMFCWGQRLDGLLGIGPGRPDYVREPTQVGNLADYQSVQANWFHTCAPRAGGVLMCWGRNIEGQLCMGDDDTREEPTAVPLDGVRAVTVGHFHSCMTRAGAVYCCGKNDEGQLGLGDRERRYVPTLVSF